ncbi:MAG: hypothetical protein KAU35_06620 [candidate division Zixibacteria bacterium]|nr:hypothetical protein [candidate division Zixibacteria bacterium]
MNNDGATDTGRVGVGIDCGNGHFHLARVRQDAGWPQVQALARFESSHIKEHCLLTGGRLAFSVGDHLVMTREVAVTDPGNFDGRLLAGFDSMQSVLDDRDEFRFDCVPLGTGGRYQASTVRRSVLEQLTRPLENGFPDISGGVDYVLRSAALGRGYIMFCRPAPEAFVCLADLHDRAISICFVYQGLIVGLTHLMTDRFDLDGDTGLERMVVEFRTLVNFKLASLSENGISIPLTSLVLSGEKAGDRVRSVLQKYFSARVEVPHIGNSFFPDPAATSGVPLERYLVALGLAAGEKPHR